MRTPTHAAIAALSLTALLGTACSDAAPRGPARRVILITCDTLRADRLGCYGYGRPTSPRIDALARESTLFTNAWSASSLTGPSLSSLHTGRYPDEVGASPTNRDLMPREAVTLAEKARDAGIATAAFVSNGVLRRAPAQQGDIGLQQGFQVYDDVMTDREINRDLLERTADDCTDATLKWVAKRSADEPFFLWVHYQDPHGPYTPPAEHLSLFERDHAGQKPLPASADHGGRDRIPKYQLLGNERRPGPYEDRYDAEIHFFDQHLGRLIDGLVARGLYEDSLIVFTADHGESLGDHGWWFCHGENLHRELVRVPLLVRYPKGVRERAAPPLNGAARVDQLACHLDLWPTVLEALGLEPVPNRGTSLFSETLPEGRVAAQFLARLQTPARRLGVTDGRWHVILRGPEAARLYDLEADPGELRNLAAERPEVLNDLHLRYTQHMESDPRPWLRPAVREMDERARRGLEALGYTDGDDGHDDGDGDD